MKYLQKKRIALTASRKTEEMQELIKKQGGESRVRSMQGTVIEDSAVIKKLIFDSLDVTIDWFIFTTGIGIETFLQHADELGVKDKFVDKLRKTNVAVRGYKAVAVLNKEQVPFELVSDDGTTKQLLQKLESYSFKGKKVVVQLYGIRSPELELFFREQQAELTIWLPYHHHAPNQDIADQLLNELLEEECYDAICFTSALQVKALFACAKARGLEQALISCLETAVLATAVGKVTAEALTESGVSRVLFPEKERMGAMVIHLGKYIDQRR